MSSMVPSGDSLSEALHGWQVTPPADRSFRQNVWRRIGKQAGVTWPTYLRANGAMVSLASIVMLTAAAYGGRALAHRQTRADRESIVVTYLVGIDPRVQAALRP